MGPCTSHASCLRSALGVRSLAETIAVAGLAMAIANLRLSVRRHGGTGGRPERVGSGGIHHDGGDRTGERRSRIPRRLCTKRVGQTLPDWAVTIVVVGASSLGRWLPR